MVGQIKLPSLPSNPLLSRLFIRQAFAPAKPQQETLSWAKGPSKTLEIKDINRRVGVTPIKLDLGRTPDEKAQSLDRIKQDKIRDMDAELEGKIKELNQLFKSETKQAFKKGLLPEPVMKTTKDAALVLGYYNSPRHKAFCELASARSGGVIPPEWFKDAEPFGGMPGGLPNDWIFYPELKGWHRQAAAKLLGLPDRTDQISDATRKKLYTNFSDDVALGNTGMAHDIDLIFGRYFKAGPLSPLFQENGRFVHTGVIPDFPEDAHILGKFTQAQLSIPNYVFSNGNTEGWRFQSISGWVNERDNVLASGLAVLPQAEKRLLRTQRALQSAGDGVKSAWLQASNFLQHQLPQLASRFQIRSPPEDM